MATPSGSSSTSNFSAKSDEEIEEMLDRMLTRLALCDDPKLENLLSKLLPLTISSLSRPSSAVRTKVIDLEVSLNHFVYSSFCPVKNALVTVECATLRALETLILRDMEENIMDSYKVKKLSGQCSSFEHTFYCKPYAVLKTSLSYSEGGSYLPLPSSQPLVVKLPGVYVCKSFFLGKGQSPGKHLFKDVIPEFMFVNLLSILLVLQKRGCKDVIPVLGISTSDGAN
ncbi:hypothetical protein L1987_19123 [Smallanthus sonchifolius]|uniref:Uncharacterized protein n=1 Tax=Smallanthus sonchifolius TaxID=185202 RepID=A0ACB9J475_9ASTR|nr:hypothetical protein L1987_19123 [Smallanthus sonchifolius]